MKRLNYLLIVCILLVPLGYSANIRFISPSGDIYSGDVSDCDLSSYPSIDCTIKNGDSCYVENFEDLFYNYCGIGLLDFYEMFEYKEYDPSILFGEIGTWYIEFSNDDISVFTSHNFDLSFPPNLDQCFYFGPVSDGNSCCANISGDETTHYFIDRDGDGLGDPSGVYLRCSNAIIPQGYVENFDDADDYNNDNSSETQDWKIRQTSSTTENDEYSCQNGLDDDSDGHVDYYDSDCQIDCPAGFSEILRYSSLDISSSKVFSMGDYRGYYPLCLDDTKTINGFQPFCPDGFIEALKYNPSTRKLSEVKNADASYTQSLCIKAPSCYVNVTCQNGFQKILSLNAKISSSATSPNVDAPYALCCNADQDGFSFENNPVAEIECSSVSDGVCPERFESSTGTLISCEKYQDPDCGYTPLSYPDVNYKKMSVDFVTPSLIDYTNTDGAIVELDDETDVGGSYRFDFIIRSDEDVAVSKTELYFNNVQSYPDVVEFDSSSIDECDSSTNPPGSNVPCYIWDDANLRLDVYHSLSDHTLRVEFNLKTISFGVIFLIIFAILIPFILIQISKGNLLSLMKKDTKKLFEKDLESVEEYILMREKAGDSIEEISESLSKAGWDDYIVHLIKNNIHRNVKDKSSLEEFIRTCQKMDVSKTKIYSVLKSLGWNKEDIDEVYRTK